MKLTLATSVAGGSTIPLSTDSTVAKSVSHRGRSHMKTIQDKVFTKFVYVARRFVTITDARAGTIVKGIGQLEPQYKSGTNACSRFSDLTSLTIHYSLIHARAQQPHSTP